MNIGDFLFELAQATLKFGQSFAELVNAKIDISKFIQLLSSIGINISLPSSISVLGILGGLGGVGILSIWIYKLIRG